MKTIAVISDIHANLPALTAVMKDIKRRHVDEIWNLGDFIGYSPYPEEVVQKVRKICTKTIVGNYDLNVLDFPSSRDKWIQKKLPAKIFSFDWTYRNISAGTRKYLAQLPARHSARVENIRFLLVHGSPNGIDDPLRKDTPKKKFLEIQKDVKEDVILCGHTHEFFDKRIGGKRFINAGSVGRAFDKNPRASYILLKISEKKLKVSHIRLRYPIDIVKKRMDQLQFPAELALSIVKGIPVDEFYADFSQMIDADFRKTIVQFAKKYNYEQIHSHHVANLALNLFYRLMSLHGLNEDRARLLWAAAILHDIGWIKGRLKHHKTARDIILNAKELPFKKDDRILVALIARYHRQALPESTHAFYKDFSPAQKRVVDCLSSFLRLSDGLDRSRRHQIRYMTCKVNLRKVILTLKTNHFSPEEKKAALKKSGLFRRTFNKSIFFKLTPLFS